VVGDAWVLRLLRSAFRGERRFGGFRDALGISRAVLSDRLERMVADDLLQREATPGGLIEYRLTVRSLDLWPLLIAMWQWERHWGTGHDPDPHHDDRPRPRLVHRVCGRSMEPRCTCRACAQVVTPFDTEAAEPIHTPEPPSQTLTPPPGVDSQPRSADDLRLDATAGQDAFAPPPRKRYRKSHGGDRSALPTLMRAFGDRWNSALLAAALQGAHTFSDFQRLTAIGTTQLADRLNELQALDLLRPRPYAGSRQTYHLTRRAIATYPITLEMMRWGDRWLWQGHSPLPVRHRPCGGILHTQWRCGHCQQPLERTELRFVAESDP
jgi:DNA-binding HxlR family transcriptional regulator